MTKSVGRSRRKRNSSAGSLLNGWKNEDPLMDRDFRAGLLSGLLAAGLIVALTMFAVMEPGGQPGPSGQSGASEAGDLAPSAIS
jgi:hypothetical protein